MAIAPAATRASAPPGSEAMAPTPPHASSITTGEVSISVLALPHVVTACVISSHASSISAIQPARAYACARIRCTAPAAAHTSTRIASAWVRFSAPADGSTL